MPALLSVVFFQSAHVEFLSIAQGRDYFKDSYESLSLSLSLSALFKTNIQCNSKMFDVTPFTRPSIYSILIGLTHQNI